MIAFLSVTSLVAGVGIACAADYAPARVATLESWGGGPADGRAGFAGACALSHAGPIIH